MKSFRFIDLFAGIGGMRIAAERNGGECVFSSEIDTAAAATYAHNFSHMPAGDITKVSECDIPNHDLLLAGFPCQPFSICGFKKGFGDTRGTLFFDIARIVAAVRPSCLLLENVKHFSVHDQGRTKARVIEVLEDLGYTVSTKVLNATNFGLAQNRERTIIVASIKNQFDFDKIKARDPVIIRDIVEPFGDFEFLDPKEYTLLHPDFVKRQTASGLIFVGYRNRALRKAGVRPDTEHLSRVHKQPNRIYSAEGTHPTLAAGESSGRYWVLLDGYVRKITMREAYRLQGFPENYSINPSASAAYKQIGNSVPIPMIAEVVKQILDQDCV